MKKLLLLAASLLAANTASAADIVAPYTKAPIMAQVFSWTGFYVGGNVGYGRSHSNFDANVTPGSFFTPASILFLSTLADGSASKDGFTGGGQIGYNYQFAPSWVVGVEADANALSHTATRNASGLTPGGTTILSFANSMESEWIATARARIGYTFDRSLFYATGGLAVLGSKYSQTFVTGRPSSVVNSGSQTTAGWTVGGGWEYAWSNNWSVKGEYLYARFDGISASGAAIPGFTDVLFGKANVEVQTARLGVNYRF